MRFITDTIYSDNYNISMSREKLFREEPSDDSIIAEVIDFFEHISLIERKVTGDAYASIIELNPTLAADLLRIGETIESPRDAYARGVAKTAATIIKIYEQEKEIKSGNFINEIEMELGRIALSNPDEYHHPDAS